jgi:antitoxin component YwqK of YwqJK toxin-antitoxin module
MNTLSRFVSHILFFILIAASAGPALGKDIAKDTDNDGRVDRVAHFDDHGALVSLTVDGDGDGRMERRQWYADRTLERVEQDLDGDGFWEHRDYYANATRRRQEVFAPNKNLLRIALFTAQGGVAKTLRDTDGSGHLDTVCTYVRGKLDVCEKDEDDNGIWELRQEFVNNTLARRLQDTNQDGFAESVITFDASSMPVRSEHDLDENRFRETVRTYVGGEVAEQEKITGPDGPVCERLFFSKGQPGRMERFAENATLPFEILEFSNGHPVIRTRDTNGNGRMNEWVDLDDKGRPVRIKQDTNDSGKPDRISLYTEGRVSVQQADQDGDGFFETTTRFEKEQPVCMERDTDRDGEPEEVVRYDGQGRKLSLTMDQSGNGRMDTWQEYTNDVLQRIRRDTTGNGRIDTEALFVNGARSRLRHDTDGDGYFETVQHYDREGWDMVLERDAGKGTPLVARLYYKEGALRKKEQLSAQGEAEYVEWFNPEGALMKSREQEPGGGHLTWMYGEKGEPLRAERDQDGDGMAEEIFVYENGLLARVEEDSNGDGKTDIWEYFDTSEALVCRKEDLDHDGRPDLVRETGGQNASVEGASEE